MAGELCGIFSVLTAVMLAAAWKFPTPFGYVLVVSPFVMFFSLFTIFVVGSRELIQSPALRKQFKDQFIIIVSQGVVAFCTKQNIANAAKSYHEYVGPVVVFSVDLFNVYYVAICMQTSKSIVTTLIIMTTDTFHHQIAPATPVEHVKLSTVESPSPSPRDLSKTTEDSISNYDEDVAHDALQTLFHSEYILLAEYIEFIVPMLYAPYLAVLFHLPVAAYYPHTASITEQKLKTTVINIMVYGVIEFVSFGALLVLLKRKFGFSPLYQLAFVLETHAAALQGHLFVWTITILHLTLKHYGVDFNILAM
ncbi:uncharacterized protein IUM83_01008 [Phytophthora cinnamomi]|uniref:uncharacterized protein n=1 Tax=Phytophthora cinnamomi TaxID=4785 RepID=UPI00355A20F3|nr:hypothetical protein IUM83_01008 [Phytophthora cinnamomi]